MSRDNRGVVKITGKALAVSIAMLAVPAAFAACGARSSLPVPGDRIAEVDASFNEPDAADANETPDVNDADAAEVTPPPVICAEPDGGVDLDAGPLCTVALTATNLVLSMATCFVDEVVSQAPGTLQYICSGGGAIVRFGSTQFLGSVTDGNVDVCASTEFSFSDGCDWLAGHHITGTIASGSLSYTYSEAPAQGQTNCASPCTASATLIISP